MRMRLLPGDRTEQTMGRGLFFSFAFLALLNSVAAFSHTTALRQPRLHRLALQVLFAAPDRQTGAAALCRRHLGVSAAQV